MATVQPLLKVRVITNSEIEALAKEVAEHLINYGLLLEDDLEVTDRDSIFSQTVYALKEILVPRLGRNTRT